MWIVLSCLLDSAVVDHLVRSSAKYSVPPSMMDPFPSVVEFEEEFPFAEFLVCRYLCFPVED